MADVAGIGDSGSETNALLSRLRADPVVSEFLKSQSQFDEEQYLSRLLGGAGDARDLSESQVSDVLSAIQQGVELIDAELKVQVAANHDPLLRQARQIRELERTMRVAGAGVANLQVSLQQIRSELYSPFETVAHLAQQLERIHRAAELLRTTGRFLTSARRLRVALASGDDADLPAAGAALAALNKLMAVSKSGEEHSDAAVPEAAGGGAAADRAGPSTAAAATRNALSQIAVVSAEMVWVGQAGREVRQRAERLLAQGLATRHQSQTALALRAFQRLGELDRQVARSLASVEDQMRADVNALVSEASKSGGSPFPIVEALLDRVLAARAQARHLQTVLAKWDRGTPGLAASLPSESAALCSSPLIVDGNQWAARQIGERLHALPLAAQRELVREYPRLRQLVVERTALNGAGEAADGKIPTMIVAESGGEDRLAAAFSPSSSLAALIAAVSSFEKSFLARSWERLRSAAVEAVQTDEGALSFAGVAADELQAACAADTQLARAVTGNVAQALRETVARARRSLTTSADASQVADSPSAAQRANAALFHVLVTLLTAVAAVTRSISAAAQSTAQCAPSIAGAPRAVNFGDASFLAAFERDLLNEDGVNERADSDDDEEDDDDNDNHGDTGDADNGRAHRPHEQDHEHESQSSAAAGGGPGAKSGDFDSLRDALDELGELVHSIVAPLFSRFAKSAENLLLKLNEHNATDGSTSRKPAADKNGPAPHEKDPMPGSAPAVADDDGGDDDDDGSSDQSAVSAPVLIIRRRLSHFSDNVLRLFNSPVLQEHREALAVRLLEAFARQAAMTRPINRRRRLRMAADFAAFESALTHLVELPRALGQTYVCFQAIKKLLFRSAEEIAELYGAADGTDSLLVDVRPMNLIHHLFSRDLSLPAPWEANAGREGGGEHNGNGDDDGDAAATAQRRTAAAVRYCREWDTLGNRALWLQIKTTLSLTTVQKSPTAQLIVNIGTRIYG